MIVPKVVERPSEGPLSLEILRSHLRLDVDTSQSPPSHPHDGLIQSLLLGACEWASAYTQRALAPMTLEIALDEFPPAVDPAIELLWPPLVSVESVKHVDTAGDVQTADPSHYVVDDNSEPPWLLPSVGNEWGDTYDVVNAVRVRYVAGYTAETLPHSIRAALLMIVGHLYENGEAVTPQTMTELPFGAKVLLQSWRLGLGV